MSNLLVINKPKHVFGRDDLSSLLRFFALRCPEMLFLFILAMCSLAFRNQDVGSFDIPNVVYLTDNSSVATASFNPLHSYPIYLDGEACHPSDLSLCITDQSEERQSQSCCESLNDSSAWPYEIVPNSKEYGIVFGVTLSILTLRALWWRTAFSQTFKADIYFWILLWWDSILALLFSLGYTAIATGVLKYSVSYPRPNYYSLTLFSSIYESEREKLSGK